MLGLRRFTVQVVPHDPQWLEEGRRWVSRIAEVAGFSTERVLHVGSTSVTGLPAKPIVDIDMVLGPSDDIEATVARLESAGFIDRGYGEDGIERLLVFESAPHVRTVHVHMTLQDSIWWRRDLAFRDALRSHPELRARYGQLKSDLARRFPEDRKAYREAKTHFIEQVLVGLAS